jgi:peptide/nickel transport system substrate-binding protein
VTVDAQTLPSGGGTGGGTVQLDEIDDVDYMDPALAYSSQSWQLLYATCAKLLNYPDRSGPAGSELVPEVAQSLPARSDGGRTYTFTIRPGFRFSPPLNQPVTAQTFKYTVERSLNPQMKSPVAGEYADIVGARAYMAGKATRISGVVADGNKLTIRLLAPALDLPARMAEPAMCAVPSGTPINPNGVRLIPSAGPYYVSSYAPGQGIALSRNRNYHGSRPHRFKRIVVNVNIPGQRAVARVQAGKSEYAVDGEVSSSDAGTLAARYGPGTAASKAGRQQYFVNPSTGLSFYVLNTHRRLFADIRLRQAVNYAVDRAAMAQLGHYGTRLPEQPTDHYLSPGIPGYSDVHVYPYRQDLAKARSLAKGYSGRTAVLYTCNVSPCPELAQVIKTDLAAIGLQLQVRMFSYDTMYAKIATPGEPFDMAAVDWGPDYLDPDAILNFLLETGTVIPTFNDPAFRSKLAAAARLTGAERYLTYARLDADLTRNAAPWIAYAEGSSHDFFSTRIGCQVHGVYGMDVAALCTRDH